MGKQYKIRVRRSAFFALPRWYRVTGHGITDVVVDQATVDGKPVRSLRHAGPLRLELWLARGGVVVYGDASKIVYKLGKDWFARQAEEVENESGGAVKLAK